MSAEREAVARALCGEYARRNYPYPSTVEPYVTLNFHRWMDEADAAIAALDAHRAGQVCVWKPDFIGSLSPHGFVRYGTPPRFCEHCGKRVEVKHD